MVETVLVIGAGASFEYGYPLGETLIDDIINSIDDSEYLEQEAIFGAQTVHPVNVGGAKVGGEFSALKQLLNFYDPLSIDSFLAHLDNKKGNEKIIRFC